MSKREGTFHQLMKARNEINQCVQSSIVFALFNSEKIKRFADYNKDKIQSADEFLARLIKMYVKHDDKEQPIHLDTKDGLARYEFVSEPAEKEFAVKYKEFMGRKIMIEY